MVDFAPDELDQETVDREVRKGLLAVDADKLYDEREEELGGELMRALERYILLQIIDERWREHLHDMDYLREGIHLRGFAQIDPLVAYKNEGFDMFTTLINAIWEEFGRYIFNVEVEVEGGTGDGAAPAQPSATWAPSSTSSSTGRLRYSGGRAAAGATAIAEAAAAPADGDIAAEGPKPVETKVLDEHERIGRNDPCWCGSGKKFKKCHGAQA